MELINKFKIARQALGKNQKEMADLVGVAYRSWQGYEQETSVPGGNVLKALSELGFNVNWFFDDNDSTMFTKTLNIEAQSEDPMRKHPLATNAAIPDVLIRGSQEFGELRRKSMTHHDSPLDQDIEEEWIMVPQYGDRLSAGGGSFVENGNEVVGHFAFKPKWLNRKCQSGKCAVFHVAGDSMFPIIQDGDVVLVDMGQNDPREVRDGKIYAFSEGDLIRVKRLSWEGSALWSISDNKPISPDRAIDMSIFSLIGRVIWVGHEVW